VESCGTYNSTTAHVNRLLRYIYELQVYQGVGSCRLRWMNYLRPNVKLGNYTEEEDLKITKLHDELGNK